MPASAPSRRERYRVQTVEEAKQTALRQIAEHGTDGLSLTAVARELGMSGPALYRYFASREELLSQLVVDGFDDLAGAVERAVEAAGSDPSARFRALTAAYRDWALAQPHRYLLVFGTPARTHTMSAAFVASAHRVMATVLSTLLDLDSVAPPDPTALHRQLVEWTADREGPTAPGHVALTAVRTWTRLHGAVSLELQGYFADMGLDPALLYEAEVDALLAAAVPPS